MAKDSGSVKGPKPTKSRGAGLSKPCVYLISLAFFQPAGNCKFKSVPKYVSLPTDLEKEYQQNF